MNVYDWDQTIYKRDSTVDFYFFELGRHPLLIRYFPLQLAGFVGYFLHIIDKTKMKGLFYRYLKGIKDIDKELALFWQGHIHNIRGYYLPIQQENDVVISASAEFLVKPACDMLGIRYCFGSQVDPYSGKILGPNNHGQQKVVRFQQEGFNLEDIDGFYSDSHGDDPLACHARHAYLVKGEKLTDWSSK